MPRTKRRPVPTQPPRREITWVPTDDLLLDPQNPRLVGSEPLRTQRDIVKRLWDEMAVAEVGLSIAENGYWPAEPLLVIPAESPRGKFVVIEGNRRLAAVLLLRDRALYDDVKADLPRVPKQRLAELEQLPVVEYGSRDDLWEYLGFQHVHGVRPWNSFSKARYIVHVHDEYREPLDEIARRIGDQYGTVQRLYRGYQILEQAKRWGFDENDVARAAGRFTFSDLYTAANSPVFREFLGLTEARSFRASPVPSSKRKALEELMLWLYGSRSGGVEPVCWTQHPHLGWLRDVVASPRALAALRAGVSLETAWKTVRGDEWRFSEALAGAKASLQEAKGVQATGYRGDTQSQELIEDIIRTAESIRDEMTEQRPPKGRRGAR